jgi:hypothetical protein
MSALKKAGGTVSLEPGGASDALLPFDMRSPSSGDAGRHLKSMQERTCTIGSTVDEFFNDAPANEPKAKPDTGSIAPRDVCKGKPDRERIPRADLLPLFRRSTN